MGLRIGFISDLHWPKVKNASDVLEEVLSIRPDVVVLTGDLAHKGAIKEKRFRFICEWLKRFEREEIPWLAVPGNHDVGDHPGNDRYSRETLRTGLKHWKRWIGCSYRMLDCGSIAIIGLNSSLFGSDTKKEARQWRWFEQTLDGLGDRELILALHYPLFVYDPENPDPDLYWSVDAESRDRIYRLTERLRLRAVLSGHIHRSFDHLWRGIRFIGGLSLEDSLDPVHPATGWQMVMVESDTILTQRFARPVHDE